MITYQDYIKMQDMFLTMMNGNQNDVRNVIDIDISHIQLSDDNNDKKFHELFKKTTRTIKTGTNKIYNTTKKALNTPTFKIPAYISSWAFLSVVSFAASMFITTMTQFMALVFLYSFFSYIIYRAISEMM